MIEELREFCEDNNLLVPAPMRRIPPHPGLTHWFAADPALETEADPAVRLEVEARFGSRTTLARAFVLQRVVYDLRYALLEGVPGAGLERTREVGTVPSLGDGLSLARAWLGGAEDDDLPRRSPLV